MIFNLVVSLSLALGATSVWAAPTSIATDGEQQQQFKDLSKPQCFSIENGQPTDKGHIDTIYNALPALESVSIPAHPEDSPAAFGSQLYYCHSTALVLVNSNGEDVTVDLASLAETLKKFDPASFDNGCSYSVSSLKTDSTTEDGALSLTIDLYSAGYSSGGTKADWDDELGAFTSGSNSTVTNACVGQ